MLRHVTPLYCLYLHFEPLFFIFFVILRQFTSTLICTHTLTLKMSKRRKWLFFIFGLSWLYIYMWCVETDRKIFILLFCNKFSTLVPLCQFIQLPCSKPNLRPWFLYKKVKITLPTSLQRKSIFCERKDLLKKKMIMILKGFTKQPDIKQNPSFSSFPILIDWYMSVFSLFL